MSLSNQVKNTGGLSNQNKSTGSLANQSKNTGNIDTGLAFLLQEISAYLLLETGGKIILNNTKDSLGFVGFSNQLKSTGSLTNQVKS